MSVPALGDVGFADRNVIRPVIRQIALKGAVGDVRASIDALADLMDEHREPLARDGAALIEERIRLSTRDEKGRIVGGAVGLCEGNALREHELLEGVKLVSQLLDRIEVGIRHGLFSCASDQEATGLPDPVMRQIIAAGGTRAGLIDVDAQTRQAIFDALAEGRAQGEGVQALANRIANQVEGGHWGNAETRARVIARTETKYAQNISTLEAGRAAGVIEYVIFDGRFGEPRSELSHIARDGKIVSAEDAWIMATNMRPNCTLSFAPHFNL